MYQARIKLLEDNTMRRGRNDGDVHPHPSTVDWRRAWETNKVEPDPFEPIVSHTIAVEFGIIAGCRPLTNTPLGVHA
jgi:hypothetical protein